MTSASFTLTEKQMALLKRLELAHLAYFLKYKHPVTGLTLDKSAPHSAASIAATGFGLTAHAILAERGVISRRQAASYVLSVLRTMWGAAQGPSVEGTSGHWGCYYHFIDPATGLRACDWKFWPELRKWFNEEKPAPPRIDVELSTLDTALFMLGVLSVRNYFHRNTKAEKEVRALADALYRRVEWDKFLTDGNLLRSGWKPELVEDKKQGFLEGVYQGFTEAFLLYLVAIGSPTHGIPAKSWLAQLANVKLEEKYGERFAQDKDSPQFIVQFLNAWFDFRHILDAWNRSRHLTWFENARSRGLNASAPY